MTEKKNRIGYVRALLRCALLLLTLILYSTLLHGPAIGLPALCLLLLVANGALLCLLPILTSLFGALFLLDFLPQNTIYFAYYLAMSALVGIYTWRGRLISDPKSDESSVHYLASYSFGLRILALAAGLLIISFRGFSPPVLFLNLVMLIFIYRSLPPDVLTSKTRIQSILPLALITVISVMVSVAILEIGCRLLLTPPNIGKTLYEPDADFICLLKPGGSAVYGIRTSPEDMTKVEYEVSPQGLRDRTYGPKAPDEFRILLLGDSFTMGHAVTPENTISRQLEDLLKSENLSKRVTVINAGMNGAGQFQERGMLLKRGFALQPDLVILQCFMINDIDDCLNTIGKSTRAYYPGWHKILNVLRRQSEFPYRVDRWLWNHSHAYALTVYALGAQGQAAHVLSTCRLFKPAPKLDLSPIEEWAFWLDVNRTRMYPELQEGWELFEHLVRDIREDCRKRDVDFAAYCIPGVGELSRTLWESLVKEHGTPKKFVRFLAIQRVMEFLEKETIPAISLIETLLPYQDRVHEIFYPLDGHPNAAGNHLIAKCLRDYLTLEYFPSKGLKP